MKKFYVIGNKASKSLSPAIFNYWFKKNKIKAKYSFIETNNINFDKNIKKTLQDKDVGGLNITIPFKQKIIKYTDNLNKHAEKIGAVNCLSIATTVKGTNTDWEGYFNSLPKIKNINKKKVLLIGYGGAALAIHYVLKKKGFNNIVIINRSRKQICFTKKKQYTVSLKHLNKYLPKADIIINTTPKNPIKTSEKKLVDQNVLLSDIVYTPKETNFLKLFPNNKKIYGIYMLLEQARLCFKIWFGFKPNIDSVLIDMLNKKIK